MFFETLGSMILPTIIGNTVGRAIGGKTGARLGTLAGSIYGGRGFFDGLLSSGQGPNPIILPDGTQSFMPSFMTGSPSGGGILDTITSAGSDFMKGIKSSVPDFGGFGGSGGGSIGNTLLMGSLLGGGGNQRVPFQGGGADIIPSQYNASGRISPDFSSKVIPVRTPSMGLIQPYSTTGFGGSRMFVDDDYLY